MLSTIKNINWDLDTEAMEKMPEVGEAGKSVDLWLLGVHPDFRGNGIANYLTKAVLPLIKKAGFKYAAIDAVNAFTSKAAEFNKFTEVHTIQASKWLWQGEPIFSKVKAPHGILTFWVKDLEELDQC